MGTCSIHVVWCNPSLQKLRYIQNISFVSQNQCSCKAKRVSGHPVWSVSWNTCLGFTVTLSNQFWRFWRVFLFSRFKTSLPLSQLFNIILKRLEKLCRQQNFTGYEHGEAHTHTHTHTHTWSQSLFYSLYPPWTLRDFNPLTQIQVFVPLPVDSQQILLSFFYFFFLSLSEVHPEHQQGTPSGPTWLMWKQNAEDGEKNVFLRSSASKSSDTNTINECSTLDVSRQSDIAQQSLRVYSPRFKGATATAVWQPCWFERPAAVQNGSISLIVWISGK